MNMSVQMKENIWLNALMTVDSNQLVNSEPKQE